MAVRRNAMTTAKCASSSASQPIAQPPAKPKAIFVMNAFRGMAVRIQIRPIVSVMTMEHSHGNTFSQRIAQTAAIRRLDSANNRRRQIFPLFLRFPSAARSDIVEAGYRLRRYASCPPLSSIRGENRGPSLCLPALPHHVKKSPLCAQATRWMSICNAPSSRPGPLSFSSPSLQCICSMA